jgi:hypothetical protein
MREYGFTPAEWEAGLVWPAYLESVKEKRDLWLSHHERAEVGPEEASRFAKLPGRRRVLVLTEDWCGDAARIVPVLAKGFSGAPGVEARYLPSDEHPRAIERFLTHGGRAIPIAIVHDEEDRPLGAWGPRPAPLQALFRARERELGRPAPEAKAAFYAPLMAWYAKDRGRTVLEEILMLLERGGRPRG